jgi:probable HAF family extracellular repeat protein
MRWHSVRVHQISIVALLVAVGAGVDAVAGTLQYQVIDLGDIGGGYTSASGLNDSGQVVGQSRVTNDPNSAEHAFLYSNGQITDIHQLGTFNSIGVAINDQGQVAGQYDAGGASERSFIYANGTMQDIGSLGGLTTRAEGINASGTIVGYGQDASGTYRAFTYANGTIKDLGILNNNNIGAYAVNNAGMVAGVNFDNRNAWVYDGTHITYITKSGYTLNPTAIDSSGDVVGEGYDQHQNIRAFIYNAGSGTVDILGTLAGKSGNGYTSWANGINDQGQVVGNSTASDGGEHAFLYENGTMYDLNNLIVPGNGAFVENAVGINYEGQIIANGFDNNGALRAFLLTPVSSVPEPSALLLASIGGLMVLAWKHSRRCAGCQH